MSFIEFENMKKFLIITLLLSLNYLFGFTQVIKSNSIEENKNYILAADNYEAYDKYDGFKLIDKKKLLLLKKGAIVRSCIRKYEGIDGEWLDIDYFEISGRTFHTPGTVAISAKYFNRIKNGIFKYAGVGVDINYGLSLGDTLYGQIIPGDETIQVTILKNGMQFIPIKDLLVKKSLIKLADGDYNFNKRERIVISSQQDEIGLSSWTAIIVLLSILFPIGIAHGLYAKDKISIKDDKLYINDEIRLCFSIIDGIVNQFYIKTIVRTTANRIGNVIHVDTDTMYRTIIRFADKEGKKFSIVRNYRIDYNAGNGDSIRCLNGKYYRSFYKLPFMIIHFTRTGEYISPPSRYYWQIAYGTLRIQHRVFFASLFLLAVLITPLIVFSLVGKNLQGVGIGLSNLYASDYFTGLAIVGLLLSILSIMCSKIIRTFKIKQAVSDSIVKYYQSKSIV